jgi:DNA-binding HxlR family transcriptional regulator
MTSKRRYEDGCAAAHALDLVGERWALLIVRELLLGPKRFTDLRVGLPGVSPNVLAQRLRELEDVGVVRRRKLAPPAASRVYELTAWGGELEPVITAMGRWGGRSPLMHHDAAMSVDSLILALRTLFDSHAAHGLGAALVLRLGEDTFHIVVGDGAFEVARGESTRPPDAVIETDTATMNALVWNDRGIAEAQSAGDLVLEGDAEVVGRFLDLFPLPEPAA